MKYRYNFKAQGPNGVCTIINRLKDMIVGSPTMVGAKKILDNQTIIYWENYLFHDMIFDYTRKEGFSLIIIMRYGRLTKVFTLEYMHKDGTDTKALSKAESYLQTIVMAEKESVGGDKYENVLKSSNTHLPETYIW